MKLVCNQLVGVMLKYATYLASHHLGRTHTRWEREEEGRLAPILN